MIKREKFERYLVNKCNCTRDQQGRDVALRHMVGGRQYTASLGNHKITEIPDGDARKFLMDLGFTDPDYTAIRLELGIR